MLLISSSSRNEYTYPSPSGIFVESVNTDIKVVIIAITITTTIISGVAIVKICNKPPIIADAAFSNNPRILFTIKFFIPLMAAFIIPPLPSLSRFPVEFISPTEFCSSFFALSIFDTAAIAAALFVALLSAFFAVLCSDFFNSSFSLFDSFSVPVFALSDSLLK